MSGSSARRWNHNIHYHRLVLDAVPRGAQTALDVGTGNGLLAADLVHRVPQVVAIDLDPTVLRSARSEAPMVEWVHGDILSHVFPADSFDVVASMATLHHLPDPVQALRRCADLTSPGGRVVVVGLARTSRPIEVVLHGIGAVQHAVLRRRYGFWEHTAPVVWPPPHTYSEVRRAARSALPGCRWRLLPMWRYCITWTKPLPGTHQPESKRGIVHG
ncbi:class I SAM-dependent methyltransferase [Pseudonocardia sp. Ae717_Ps2]|uniref:class I SAM-dependent methyltransferase n=1 Tax=Pseudonocardia sp. Ae717_Ps2 TaxID=1885573 RepID=UPI00094B0BB8